MNQRTNIWYGLILLVLFSCSNGEQKSTSERETISKKEEIQFGDDAWIKRELKKQLNQTITQDSIEIHGLPIEDIPELLYDYPNIRYLRIDCTSFECMKSLSKRIKEFINLETLIISKSALKELPIEIGELSNLKKLMILGGGQLRSIPNEILKLQNLEELDLWRNSLTKWPIELNKMKKLKSINLGENKFSKDFFKSIKMKYPIIEIKQYR